MMHFLVTSSFCDGLGFDLRLTLVAARLSSGGPFHVSSAKFLLQVA